MTQPAIQQIAQYRLRRFIEQDFNSTPYLIMTMFGDYVIPFGGEIWLGSLVQLLKPLSVNERLVRTSIFRLSKDGWLKSQKIGRKSYYHACQIDVIERNEQRIFFQQDKWDGNWRFIIGISMETASVERDAFRKKLLKEGFCAISSNVFGHPTYPFKQLEKLLAHYSLSDAYVLVRGRDVDGEPLEFERAGRIIHRCLMDELENSYNSILALYRPLYEAREALDQLTAEQSFCLRAVLINDYRRVLWHDTVRSNLLFDDDWVGRRVRKTVAAIYCGIEEKSSQYFESIAQNASGLLLPKAASYQQRFKHLR